MKNDRVTPPRMKHGSNTDEIKKKMANQVKCESWKCIRNESKPDTFSCPFRFESLPTSASLGLFLTFSVTSNPCFICVSSVVIPRLTLALAVAVS